MDYPKHIVDELAKYEGKSVFYFLEINAKDGVSTYKFGISTQCNTRVRTHCRKLGVLRVIKLIDCIYDSVMRTVETEFKRYAKSVGVMVTLFENTEILVTEEINIYINWVECAIKAELLKPQPKNIRNIPVAGDDQPGNTANKTCYNCGKTFHTPTDLERHKKRKTPCLIREISDADKNNPLRCIYCNKIFSNVSHLTRHHKICKVKNGGMQTLHDKVKYEETLRIMQELQEKKDKDIQEMFSAMQSQLNDQRGLIETLVAENKGLRKDRLAQNNNNAPVGAIINGDVNAPVTVNNITINVTNYDAPNLDYLRNLETFSKILNRELAMTPIALVEWIWYDILPRLKSRVSYQ